MVQHNPNHPKRTLPSRVEQGYSFTMRDTRLKILDPAQLKLELVVEPQPVEIESEEDES